MFSPGPRGKKKEKTKLEAVLAANGGAYKTTGLDSVFFQIYTHVEFGDVLTQRRTIAVELGLDAPAGAARNEKSKQRQEFWKHSRKLQSGSLIAFVIVTRGTPHVLLGEIVSFGDDVAESAKHSRTRITIKAAFFDPKVEFMALKQQRLTEGQNTFAFIIDNGIMLESIRPFLQRMQTIEPTDIPFSRYICSHDALNGVAVDPPKYARAPNFEFNLQCLAKQGRRIPSLNVMRPTSVTIARQNLLQSSELDPSQVDAVMDSLTKEVSLIQG